MPSMTVTSAAMRRLRLKLQSSRIALAPTGGSMIAKKSPNTTSAPTRERSDSDSDSESMTISKGAKVRVRASAGQRLVLILDAVVFSATEDGYVGVYNGANPLVTMRVERDEVRLMPPPPASVT